MDIITPKFQPVFLTRSFVKNEDKVRVMKFEPIEVYLSLMIMHYMNTELLCHKIHDIRVVIHLTNTNVSVYAGNMFNWYQFKLL